MTNDEQLAWLRKRAPIANTVRYDPESGSVFVFATHVNGVELVAPVALRISWQSLAVEIVPEFLAKTMALLHGTTQALQAMQNAKAKLVVESGGREH